MIENDDLFDEIEVDESHPPIGGVRSSVVPKNRRYPTWNLEDFRALGLRDIMRGQRPILPSNSPKRNPRRVRYGPREGNRRDWRRFISRRWTLAEIRDREHHYIYERVVSYLKPDGVRVVGNNALKYSDVIEILEEQGYTLHEAQDFHGERLEVFKRPEE
ncbi:hypothetical protein [Paramicrobacterium fandaimingii]|uniref:hypothetical protein n=1 Tax=Paramicrobacterium fandaimingii TaxID=2708079 RepID=UPI00141D75B1|nr:hypothetical protein [Microbacterium fandaimingii]